MQSHLSLLASRYETHKTSIDEIMASREAIATARECALNDTHLLLRMLAGADEATSAPAAATSAAAASPTANGDDDVSDLLLLPASTVEGVNTDVRHLGGIKISHLTNIKRIRSGLNYATWEATYTSAVAASTVQFMRDNQLMRATGPVKDFIVASIAASASTRGGANSTASSNAGASAMAASARASVEKAEAAAAAARRAHERAVVKLGKSEGLLAKEVETRQAGLGVVEGKVEALREGVALREAILRSRQSQPHAQPLQNQLGGGDDDQQLHLQSIGGNDPGSAASSAAAVRLRGVAVASKLTAVAKEQAKEIVRLRNELARLRERSYPSFT